MEPFKNGTSRIKIGGVNVGEGGAEAEMVTSYSDLSPERLQELQTIYESIAAGQPLDTRQLMSMVAGFIVAFRREYNPFMALAPIRNLDDYTFTHSINVGILNVAQAMSLGISGELLHDMGVAGMLHDAGKIFIDRAIIQKPGSLTDEEFALMKTHPVRGAHYLMGQEGVPKLAVITAFEHHMRFDRKGYPLPPEGWSLNLCSQITMISDTFDALRTKRIYKDPWDFPAVCGHMLTLAGSQLNEDLTINFLDLLARMGDGLPPAQLDDTVPSRECYCE
jgi:HD-GYP domain-containing protein (c-di-GMP phosphodiesterase class II)